MADTAYLTRKSIDKAFSRKIKGPYLGKLDIELTERCNNDCIHCLINLQKDDVDAKRRELPTKKIKEILKEAVSLGCMMVRFTGGEPLLREDFEELYVFARRQGLRTLIFTNATFITPHFADLFSRIPPKEKIEVTVYGMKKASYEATTRTPGSFEAAWRGINLLLDRQIPFVVKRPVLPANKLEIEEFEKWAASIPWMDKGPSYAMFFDLRCRRDNLQKNALIKNLRLSPEEGLKVLTRRAEAYRKEMKEFCAKFTSPPGERLFPCGAGVGGGCVDAYGSFQACMLLRHPDAVYDLNGGSLKDAITNFFPKLREMKTSNPDYISRCARCFLKGLCEQCPAKSWMEYGTLDTPVEYLCEVTHSQSRYLGLLEKNEMAWEVEDWKKRIKDFVEKE